MKAEVYKFNGKYYFESEDGLEGEIILGNDDPYSEVLEILDIELLPEAMYDLTIGASNYSSPIEFVDAITDYLNDNFHLILNAKGI